MTISSVSAHSRVFSRPLPMLTLGGLFALNAVSLDGPIVAIPAIAQQFSVSTGQAQLVLAVFLLGFALGHIPAGLLGDRFGRRPVILTGMACTSLLAIAASIAPQFDILVATRFGQGLTSACGGLLCRAIVRDVASGREASRLTSNALSCLAVLIIITPLLSSLFLELFGWRSVLAIVAAYVSIITILTMRFIPETLNVKSERASPWTQFTISLIAFSQSRQSIFATLLGSVVFSTYFIFPIIGASALVDIYGLKAALFGPIFAGAAIVQLLGAQINSRFVRRIGVRRILGLALVFSMIGTAFAMGSLLSLVLPLPVFIFIGMAFAMSHGMTLPNAIALTLDPLPGSAGFAASINGMCQTGIAAVVALLVSGGFYDGNSQSLARLFLIFGSLNLTAYVLYFLVGQSGQHQSTM